MTKIQNLLLISVAIAAYLIPTGFATQHLVGDEPGMPCSYYDTVNLTDIKPFQNGSYLYDGVIIPSELVAMYDYEFVTWVQKKLVAPHPRGCICRLRSCVRMCCDHHQVFETVGNKSACVDPSETVNNIVSVLGSAGQQQLVNIYQHFVIQPGRPCDHMYQLEPQYNDFDNWTLFENGTLLLEEDKQLIHKDSYCFNPHKLQMNMSTMYIVNPMNCMTDVETSTKDILYSYTMLFSVPFMILTIIIYMSVPELRNLHGKSLSCYLGSLVVGYSILSYMLISGTATLSDQMCSVIGFFAYFFFMASFFWLSVISFDLWWNFRGTRGINRFNERKRFLIYSFYAWGFAAIFLAFTMFAQSSGMPENWKPGIGGADFCWLNVKHGWAGLFYFYGPILIILVLNITLFIMTSLKIHNVQKDLARMMAKDDSQKNLRNEKDNFGLFLRLFIVMGVTWLTEVISYFVGSESKYAKLFYLTDVCNAIQGFIIFALFVLKKKVKHLILKRYGANSSIRTERSSQCSTKTTTSGIHMTVNATSTNTSDKPLLEKSNSKQINA